MSRGRSRGAHRPTRAALARRPPRYPESAPIAHGAKNAVAATDAIAAHRLALCIVPSPSDLPNTSRILPDASHQLPEAPPPPELPPPPENPPPPDDPDDELPPDVNTMPPIVAVPLVFMSSDAFAYHGMRVSTSLAIG